MSTIFQKLTLHFMRLSSLSIGAALGILCGFTGCGNTVMYGMPHADYKVSGTAASSDQNMPIKGLLVSIADTLLPSRVIDSTRTDSLGRYSLQFSSAPWDNTWRLKTEPRDTWDKGHGEKNVDIKVNRANP